MARIAFVLVILVVLIVGVLYLAGICQWDGEENGVSGPLNSLEEGAEELDEQYVQPIGEALGFSK